MKLRDQGMIQAQATLVPRLLPDRRCVALLICILPAGRILRTQLLQALLICTLPAGRTLLAEALWELLRRVRQ